MKQLKAIMVVLWCLVPALVYAQDDIPPEWNQPPFKIGPFNTNPDHFDSGDVPYTYLTVWGAEPGDKVFLDVIVTTGPFDNQHGDTGQLWLSPVCSNCTSMQITDPSQWNQGWWGTFCGQGARCEVTAIAAEENPTFWLRAVQYKNLRLRTHLEQKQIITGARPSPISQAIKDSSHKQAVAFTTGALLFNGAAAATWISPPISALSLAGGVGMAFFAAHFQHIANDPPEPGDPYIAVIDEQMANDLAWVCAYVQEQAPDGTLSNICPQLIKAMLQVEALTKAIGENLDRQQDGYVIAYFQAASPWLEQLATLHRQIGDYMNYEIHLNGMIDDNWDMISFLYDLSNKLYDASQTFQGVQ